jgi:tetratricopeptide (TPR) repeat protein
VTAGLQLRACAGVLGLVVAATAPAPVRAANKPTTAELARAEELYDNGRTLFAEGSYDAAATAFEQAYALSGNLDMLYNAALAHDRAGRFEEAILALDRYRALAPASERATLDERKKSLQRRLDKQREAAAAEPQPAADAPTPGETSVTPYPSTAPRRRRVRPVTWALLGVAAGGVVVGTALGATSLSRTKAANGGCTQSAGMLLCGDDVASAARSSRPLAIGADVAFAIAGATTVAFVALLVLDLRRGGAPTQARLRPRPGGLAWAF